MMLFTQVIHTPIGPLLAAADERGLRLLEFDDTPRAQAHLANLCRRLNTGAQPGSSAVLDQLAAEIEAYFAGRLRAFCVPLAPPGSAFQQRVWQALRAVPYGTTLTYAQIAARIGAPRACRAVGAANGQNPIAILIPCHRLVSSAGRLAGYGGGLWRKQYLLNLENQKLA